MLRLLISTGLLLMAAGFGAAGWQFWHGIDRGNPGMATERANSVDTGQPWLISATGTPVSRLEAEAYLAQERLVPARRAALTLKANLAALLSQGEKLPEEPYLQVLADIRAPVLARPLCAVLTERIAADCAVDSARVVEGSVDPLQGTAAFRIELVYRLKPQDQEMPDPASHVLNQRAVELEIADNAAGAAEAALGNAIDVAAIACKNAGKSCRLLRIDLDLLAASGRAHIAWLAPMPAGMSVAPPLGPLVGH